MSLNMTDVSKVTTDYLTKANNILKWTSRGFICDQNVCSVAEINTFLRRLERDKGAPLTLAIVKSESSFEDIKSYSCSRCEKHFSHSISLARHNRIDHKRSGYVCNNCNKVFTRMENLRVHVDNCSI